ncbi:MAG: M81 family metallopeptidase [Thermomicrobiales bacterium]
MRIAIGGVSHETNTFSNIRTTMDLFQQCEGQQILDTFRGTQSSLGGFIEIAAREKFDVVPTFFGRATPSGIVAADAIEAMEQRILDGIAAARADGGLDGVLLALHGAMVTEVDDDGEGHILHRVRALVGPEMPVVATLDWHCYISETMVRDADVLVTYDTYPHVDNWERAIEAGEILMRILRDGLKPTAARSHPPMLIFGPKTYSEQPPMQTVVRKAHEIERDPRVVTVTVAPGFPYSDIPGAGQYFYVVTANDSALAQRYADELARFMWEMRREFIPDLAMPEEAVRRAMDAAQGPVVLSDQGDNPGGGAPEDGTILLTSLLDAGATNAAVAVIADPDAAAQAIAAGMGAEITLTIGGKRDTLHGAPITVTGIVRNVTDGIYHNKGPMGTGVRMEMGPTAVFDVHGVEILLTTKRVQPTDLEIFRSQGIEPTTKQILMVKSNVHFRAAFTPIAAEIIDVDTPGLTTPHLDQLPYQRLQRPIFPFDEIEWDGESRQSAVSSRQ